MANILKWNHSQPGWLTITHPIDVKKDEEKLEVIADRLRNAMEQEPEVPYATANQVGYDYQVYALRTGDGIEVWANPIMARSTDNMVLVEDKEYGLENTYYLPRWPKINVIAFSYDKKLVCGREYENEGAVVLQHVMNNLNGLSLADTGLEITDEFRNAPKEEQVEVVQAYIQELENLLNKLEEDIAADSEMSQKYEAFKFVKAKAAEEIESTPEIKPNRKARRLLDRLFKRKKKA